MCCNCQDFEEVLMLNGIELGELGQASACAEDEYYSELLDMCIPIPLWPDSPPPPDVPSPICEPPFVLSESGYSCVLPDPTEPQTPPGFVAPGAVPVVVAAWDLEAQPYALYTLQWGDTYVGLSATYLGDGARWKEIWNLNRTQHPDPDTIYVSQTINMPDEARDKLKRWLQGPKKDLPGKLPDQPTPTERVRSMAPWLLAAAALAAGGYYLVS